MCSFYVSTYESRLSYVPRNDSTVRRYNTNTYELFKKIIVDNRELDSLCFLLLSPPLLVHPRRHDHVCCAALLHTLEEHQWQLFREI